MERISEKMSFSDFCEIWRNKFGDQGTNIWETYKKWSNFPRENVIKSLENMSLSNFSTDVQKLAPMVKTADYVDYVRKQVESINQKYDQYKAIDDKNTLFLMVFQKGEDEMMNEKKKCNCICSLSPDDNFQQNLFSSFENFYQTKAKFEFASPSFSDFVQVGPEDPLNPILFKMVLPSFISKLKEELKMADVDQLIVVPYTRNILYATKSSSPIGCCMLGDFSDVIDAANSTPEWISSLPYTINSINTSEPELELLKKGIVPIEWKLYEFFGKEPLIGIERKKKICFPVPGSTIQAKSFLEKIKISKDLIKVLKIESTFCSGCYKENDVFMRCGKCLNVYYCSKECQVKHWEFHKLICKKI